MCLSGVLGTYLGMLVESQMLLGRSLGVLGAAWGTLGTPWGSLVALGIPLDELLWDSWRFFGESLSEPSAPYATHTNASAFSVIRCSGVAC